MNEKQDRLAKEIWHIVPSIAIKLIGIDAVGALGYFAWFSL